MSCDMIISGNFCFFPGALLLERVNSALVIGFSFRPILRLQKHYTEEEGRGTRNGYEASKGSRGISGL